LLVGDAGGFPINYTGEGIRPALITGKFAAETLIKNLELSRAYLREYVVKWSKALRDEYIMGDMLQMIFSSVDYDLMKALFIEDRRFRGLFFDLFFNLKKPREALRRFLLYSPLLSVRYLRYGVKSLLENLLAS
jgi:flavin-dependent dehydrogenase